METKVSVIIPIYKVASFVERCAESLFSQTLNELEFIFVDDASPDNSIEIVKNILHKYPERACQVKFIRHEQNKGLPSARNSGLAVAEGEYIFHCDGDDYVEPDMLSTMHQCAVDNDADIVWCDWFLSFAQTERYMIQPSFTEPLSAVKSMLGGGMKYNVWNKIAKRSLYTENNIVFPSGYGMGEDMTMIMLFAFSDKIMHIKKALYHYVKTNSSAFSQTYSDRHLIELRYNVDRLESFIHNQYGDSLEKELAFMKLEAKFPLLLSNDSSRFNLWSEWYPESNAYIMNNTHTSLRRRIIQYFASRKMWLLVKTYNSMFNVIVYGILNK